MSYWARINVGLAFALLVLAAPLLWPEAEQNADRLTALSPDHVTSIRIERGNRLVLALQRTPESWRLTHPRAAAAKTRQVKRLLSMLEAPVLQRIPSGASAADFGLDSPRAVVSFDDLRVHFGNTDLSQRLRYVSVDDELYAIDEAFFALLALPAQHYAEN